MSQWNGVSFWLLPGLLPEADVAVPLDAAGSLGYGVFLTFRASGSLGPRFLLSSSSLSLIRSCSQQQLLPTFWCHHWCRKHLLFRSDNHVVVHISNARTSKVPCLMWLLRILLLAVVRHSFSKHVQGVKNQSADALSHCRWQESRQLAPNTQPHATLIQVPLVLLTDLSSLI